MKILVVNYSKTGNNKLLADIISKKLSVDTEDIIVKKKMSMMSIVFDMMFSRTPPINEPVKNPADYDHVVMIAPIWMGKVASPLFSYIKKYSHTIKNYSFITISGGALGSNDNFPAHIDDIVGKKSANTTQLFINDLLTGADKNQMKKTAAYLVNEHDIVTRLQPQFDEFIESLSIV